MARRGQQDDRPVLNASAAKDQQQRDLRTVFDSRDAATCGARHRDGRFAQAYWTYADATVEEKIARVVAGRISR
jgi:hypothetical protein